MRVWDKSPASNPPLSISSLEGQWTVVGELRPPKPDGPSLIPEQGAQPLCALGSSFVKLGQK